VQLADQWIASGKPGYVCVSAVHSIMEAHNDPDFLRILNGALLNVPEGMPLTWVERLQRHREMDGVFGLNFILAMCRLPVQREYPHFIYGEHRRGGIAARSADRVISRFVDRRCQYASFRRLNPEEEFELVNGVRRN
jgi:N-acetylglucosaminyldiphosphoundecaprenol N-acetyl-beta-D-mannosaminyltransferase